MDELYEREIRYIRTNNAALLNMLVFAVDHLITDEVVADERLTEIRAQLSAWLSIYHAQIDEEADRQ